MVGLINGNTKKVPLKLCVFLGDCALSNGKYGEPFPCLVPSCNGGNYFIDIIGNLWQQDNVRAPCNAMKQTYYKLRLDCLVILGGNGTQKTANLLREEGLNIIHLPKTIDKRAATS